MRACFGFVRMLFILIFPVTRFSELWLWQCFAHSLYFCNKYINCKAEGWYIEAFCFFIKRGLFRFTAM